MLKYLILSLLTVSFLGGCSSSKQVDLAYDEPQYCYTDETITIDNDHSVDTNTTISCTDKPRVEHFLKTSGVAKNCRPYKSRVNIRGNYKNVQGFLCQMPDGTWQAVDGRYRY